MVKGFIRKITDSLRLHGPKFTLQLICFFIFGGKDPRNTEEFITRMGKYLEPELYRAAISPYWLTPNALSNEDLLQLHRALLPIDCMPFISIGIKRINIVLDDLNDATFDRLKDLLALSAKYAVDFKYELRIITRCAPCNPYHFHKTATKYGILLPENVEFYNDISRNNFGDCPFKLPLLPEDVFIATSWYSAVAVSGNTLFPTFYYYITNLPADLSKEQQNLIFDVLSSNKVCFIGRTQLRKELSTSYPALSHNFICLEDFDSNTL